MNSNFSLFQNILANAYILPSPCLWHGVYAFLKFTMWHGNSVMIKTQRTVLTYLLYYLYFILSSSHKMGKDVFQSNHFRYQGRNTKISSSSQEDKKRKQRKYLQVNSLHFQSSTSKKFGKSLRKKGTKGQAKAFLNPTKLVV